MPFTFSAFSSTCPSSTPAILAEDSSLMKVTTGRSSKMAPQEEEIHKLHRLELNMTTRVGI
jgi:hypothetical protein